MANLTTDFVTVNANGEGRIGASDNSSFANARNAATGTVSTAELIAESRDTGSSPRWFNTRIFFNFNTAALPANAQILSVVLRLYADLVTNSDSISGHVVQTSQDSTTSLSTSDYNNLSFSSGGSIAASAIVIGSYNEITLNDTGEGWVVAGGVTKLGLITSLDLNNGTPTSNNILNFQTSSEANPPQLRINYLTQGGNRGYIF